MYVSKYSEDLASDSRQAAQEAINERTKALENHGLTFDYLAKKLKRELNAKKTITQKVKGSPGNEMPDGYRRIVTTGLIEYVKGEDGPEKEYSDGDSLIQWDETAWDIRQRARIDAHKLRGDYPAEKREHTHSITGSLIDDLMAAKEKAHGGK